MKKTLILFTISVFVFLLYPQEPSSNSEKVNVAQKNNPYQEKQLKPNKNTKLFFFENTKIALLAHNGKYVCADAKIQHKVAANRSNLDSWETFELIKAKDEQYGYHLKAYNGNYVYVDLDKTGGQLLADGNDDDAIERTFELVYLDEVKRYVLKNFYGLFVCADSSQNDILVANRHWVDEWELFKMIIIKGNPPSECDIKRGPKYPCWVRIYEDDDYQDNFILLKGPGRFNNLKSIPGIAKDWKNEIDSLEVGPRTRVLLWDKKDFTGNAREFGPNASIMNLDNYAFGDKIQSMVIQYVERYGKYSKCWVEIFEDDDFSKKDNSDIIYGPGRWANLSGLPNAKLHNWNNQIDSLRVGPEAKVTLYSKKNFRGKRITFVPYFIVKDLDNFNDLGDDVESMVIEELKLK